MTDSHNARAEREAMDRGGILAARVCADLPTVKTDPEIETTVECLRREGEANNDQVAVFEKRYRERGPASAWRLLRRVLYGHGGGVCWAKKKDGIRCVGRPASSNGRCRHHGGLSTGARTPEGKARISRANKKRWALWRYENDRPAKAGDARYLPKGKAPTLSRVRAFLRLQ